MKTRGMIFVRDEEAAIELARREFFSKTVGLSCALHLRQRVREVLTEFGVKGELNSEIQYDFFLLEMSLTIDYYRSMLDAIERKLNALAGIPQELVAKLLGIWMKHHPANVFSFIGHSPVGVSNDNRVFRRNRFGPASLNFKG